MKNMFGFLTDVRKLAVVAMLIALTVLIRAYVVITIPPALKIDIGAVPIIIALGILFGPLAGAIAGASVDLLSYLLTAGSQPGPINPFITIGFALYGLVAGIYFFRKSEKASLLLTEIFTGIAYIIGFLVITIGLSIVLGSKDQSFIQNLGYWFGIRSISLVHLVWYLVLTPVLVITGEKLMADWQNR
jgi:ECF transporter S component (folate family)